ncbi:MAG: hypothetical protein FWC80_00505 [Firmicutes bacterium]|nr:hypothetical protein [Bacillota bacterium]
MSGFYSRNNRLNDKVANYASTSPIHKSLCFRLSGRNFIPSGTERYYLTRQTAILNGWWGNSLVSTDFRDTNGELPFTAPASGFVPHRPSNLSAVNWGVRRLVGGETRWYRACGSQGAGIYESIDTTNGTNGNWTALKLGHSLMIIDMIGGGGSGGNPNTGSSNTAAAGGGGGSGGFLSYAINLSIVGVIRVVVGRGGDQSNIDGDTVGRNGGSTSIEFMSVSVPTVILGLSLRTMRSITASGGRGGQSGGSTNSGTIGGHGGAGGTTSLPSVSIGGIQLLTRTSGLSGGSGGRSNSGGTHTNGAAGGSYANNDNTVIDGSGIIPNIRVHMANLRGVGSSGRTPLITHNGGNGINNTGSVLDRRAGGGGGAGSVLGITTATSSGGSSTMGYGSGGLGGSRSTTSGLFTGGFWWRGLNGRTGAAILHY